MDKSALFMVKVKRPRKSGQRQGEVFIYTVLAKSTTHAQNLVKQNGFEIEKDDTVTITPMGTRVLLHAHYHE